MAAPKRWFFFFFVTLILLAYVYSETLHDYYEAQQSDHSSLHIKHEQLLSKILNLESSIDERSREINSKDERIKQLEMIVLEKSNSLTSLHSEIQSLQKKESFIAKELEGEAQARASELIKQVENLKAEISKQNAKEETLEAQINVAEKKISELNVKLEKQLFFWFQLQRINEEQKIIIHDTEHALQKAEEERIRIQLNAVRYYGELDKVHESWLPSWLAVPLVHYQSILVTHWNVYGRPALDTTVQKALETQAQIRKWAQPHIDELHTKWIPSIKDQWLTFVTNTEPYVQMLTAKSVEIYDKTRKTIRPHITNIQTILNPYIKKAKKFTKPYINHLSKTLGPHINKAHIFLKPYTKKILRGYRRFSKTILRYHRRVRANIDNILKENEFTRPLARYEVVWFLASAFMVFPVMVLLSWLSALLSKKPRRHTRSSHTGHSRRRAKRVHPNNASASR